MSLVHNVCVCVCDIVVISLSEYADLNGRIPEDKVWKILVDLLQVLSVCVCVYVCM